MLACQRLEPRDNIEELFVDRSLTLLVERRAQSIEQLVNVPLSPLHRCQATGKRLPASSGRRELFRLPGDFRIN
jgi:hypothetical protein